MREMNLFIKKLRFKWKISMVKWSKFKKKKKTHTLKRLISSSRASIKKK